MQLPQISNTETIQDLTEYPDCFFSSISIRYNGITGFSDDDPYGPRALMSMRYSVNPLNYSTGQMLDSKSTHAIPDIYLLAHKYKRIEDCMNEFVSCLGEMNTLANHADVSVRAQAAKNISSAEAISDLNDLYNEIFSRDCDDDGYISHLGLVNAGLIDDVRTILLDSEEYTNSL